MRVGIEEQRHHHGRMERRKSLLFHVSIENRAEVQFLDHEVADEMSLDPCQRMRWHGGRMPLGDEFGDLGWQQPLLLGVPGPESLGHTSLIVPDRPSISFGARDSRILQVGALRPPN